jgi:hypothetical protein
MIERNLMKLTLFILSIFIIGSNIGCSNLAPVGMVGLSVEQQEMARWTIDAWNMTVDEQYMVSGEDDYCYQAVMDAGIFIPRTHDEFSSAIVSCASAREACGTPWSDLEGECPYASMDPEEEVGLLNGFVCFSWLDWKSGIVIAPTSYRRGNGGWLSHECTFFHEVIHILERCKTHPRPNAWSFSDHDGHYWRTIMTEHFRCGYI